MRKILKLLVLFFIPVILLSQSGPLPSLQIKKAVSKITIDGELNENDWQAADTAKDFFQNFPADTSYAITKTEAFVTYDEDNFYVAAICYDSLPGDYVIQSLKRDFSYPISDAFAVYLDPFYDKTNGFCFTVNPLGVQREGVIEGGGAFGVTTNWDNRWFSEVKQYENKWVVEMAIPFKTIRFKEGMTLWGINFLRNDLKRNENASWAAVPRVFNIGSLAFCGELHWDASPQKKGANISVIPYATGSANRDFLNDSITHYKAGTGLDAKVAVTSSLNLDLTYNPDFSQTEADQQQTNLTRFSLFYPEKRQFFIENSDLFANFGFRQIRPFFSRRIGLYNGNPVPIIAGARLSGKLDENWRIGAMNMTTSKDTALGINGQNYSVAAFQRTIFRRSNIAGIFVNRQEIINGDLRYFHYNRIVGLDYNLASADNKWFGKFFYHHSLTREKYSDNYSHASFLLYNTRTLFIMWNHEYVRKNYLADVGFVPRIYNYDASRNTVFRFSYWRFEPEISYKFYPKSEVVNYHGPSFYSSIYLDSAGRTTESMYKAGYIFQFNNSSSFNAEIHKHGTQLFFPTDVTQTGNLPLPAMHYHYNMLRLTYQSNLRKKFNGRVGVRGGGFYNGYFISSDGELNFRKQPWGIFSLSYMVDDIHLPPPYKGSTLWLLGPKIELSFSKSIFFTTFIQYNTQMDNLNINSRLQWRFKPMSDVFVVYSDNYDSLLGRKNRALVLKFVYWFTV